MFTILDLVHVDEMLLIMHQYVAHLDYIKIHKSVTDYAVVLSQQYEFNKCTNLYTLEGACQLSYLHQIVLFPDIE